MFTCNATGVPLPGIMWSGASGQNIEPQSDEVINTAGGMIRQSQIMLSNLQLGDFGTYTCTAATNQFGSDSEMASLECKMILISTANVYIILIQYIWKIHIVCVNV